MPRTEKLAGRGLVLAALVAVSGFANAGEISPEKLLIQMRKAYSSVKAARWATTAKVLDERIGAKRVVKSETEFRPPSSAAIRITSGASVGGRQMTMMHDGYDILLIGVPVKDKLRKYSIGQVMAFASLNLESLCFWDWNRLLSTGKDGLMKNSKLTVSREKWKNVEFFVLREQTKDLIAKYYVHPKTKVIWRSTWLNPTDKKLLMECHLDWLDLNADVDGEQFAVLRRASFLSAK